MADNRHETSYIWPGERIGLPHHRNRTPGKCPGPCTFLRQRWLIAALIGDIKTDRAVSRNGPTGLSAYAMLPIRCAAGQNQRRRLRAITGFSRLHPIGLPNWPHSLLWTRRAHRATRRRKRSPICSLTPPHATHDFPV